MKSKWPDTFNEAAKLLREENKVGLVEKLDELRKQTPKGMRLEFDAYYEGAAIIIASTN